MVHVLMAVWAGLAILFAVVAVMCKIIHISEPNWLLRVFQGMAVVATIVVVLMVVG
jgi:uncharacterized BrkB/YihY/UPF0761 family membrane protein